MDSEFWILHLAVVTSYVLSASLIKWARNEANVHGLFRRARPIRAGLRDPAQRGFEGGRFWGSLPGVALTPECSLTPGYYRPPLRGSQFAPAAIIQF